MKAVTMLELQQNTKVVVRDLRHGMTLILTHDCQPLARLVPILPATKSIAADDLLYTLAEQAGCAVDEAKVMRASVNFTNTGIDRALYGG